jgi:hypothetical protein
LLCRSIKITQNLKHRKAMNKNNNSREKSMELREAQNLENFLRIYSGVNDGDHGTEGMEEEAEIQNSPCCANCGRPATYGMFCSTSCEMDIVS